MIPSGMAMRSAIPSDSAAISSVTGMRAAISETTVVLGRTTELPRSPWSALPSHVK